MSNLCKRRLMSVLFMALTFILSGTHDTYADDRVVATVNGMTIKEEALTAEVNKKLPRASYHARVSEQKLREFRDQALQKLIEEELLYQEAKKQKLVLKPFELLQQIELMKSGYATEKDFQHALAKAGLNNLSLMQRLERRLLIQKIQQEQIIQKVNVTDSDIREYFKANREKFIVPKRFRLRHILISVNPGAMAAGWQAGLEKAQQVHSRILAGQDFAELAKEISADSSSRDKGGDIGWVHKGQLIPELEAALEGMQIGEVSKPIRSIYGFHLLKFEGQKPEKQLTFDEINHEKLKKKLTKKRIEARRQEYLSHLKARSDIRVFEF
jgi:parvulin-like peptidyl-prolyl isomerase